MARASAALGRLALVWACLVLTAACSRWRSEQLLTTRRSAASAAVNVEKKPSIQPPCASVRCPHVECPPPLKKETQGTCCGICTAPDEVVPSMDGPPVNSPYVTEKMCHDAPPGCRGAKCFVPSCPAGVEPKCSPGDCCESCGLS
eukprot:gnl/TRDRNA2_/TRDRNA2_164107_c0_seq1.p2 gnl/TRDRNA2_/TRDRNA2_164107_c0~~gnl/TRDRNA2_/TRDRNA2_164107_c0_seq1.p2  ORF type:complete len:145 (+),score=22.12 gnl/TRDRNA2_/TRDRNA2_164107_c0_seq1:61-495(+)